MTLELAINNALTGLNVNQRALSVVSQNISNANTEGYTRKQVDLSAVKLPGAEVGAGVRVDDISRKVDTYLQRTFRSQTSQTSRSDEIRDVFDRIQLLLGEPGDVNTLDQFTNAFFNDLQTLADTPESVSLRETAVDSGILLARELSETATDLEDLRLQADTDLDQATNRLNELLADLDQANAAIANANALGNPISGLQDEQDQIIKQMSELLDVNVLRQDNNELYVFAGNGIPLLTESAYEVDYKAAFSQETFVEDSSVNPINVFRLDSSGERIQPPVELVSGGVQSEVTTRIKEGEIKALLDLRDSMIPDITAQLDEFAATFRDNFNAIHNDGSSFPGATELTGTREVRANEAYNWAGSVRIAALDGNGDPIRSPFPDEGDSGVRPLNLDLSNLDGGNGAGQPDVQTIIDEINDHFNPPTTKVRVGNLNNIQLSAITDNLPNSANNFEFDFDIDNISGLDSDVYVSGVQVLDDGGADITNVTSDRPSLPITQFQTTNLSSTVTVDSANHGLQEGEVVFIEQPGGAINGIPASDFGQYFQVSNVTTNSFTIETTSSASSTGPAVPGGASVLPKYDTVEAGEKTRLRDEGTISADLSGNPASGFYDIVVDVGVLDEEGGAPNDVETGTITYRVFNNTRNLMNDRFDNTAATGPNVERTVPSDNTPFLQAILVDENGNELPKSNGDYINQDGFVKLEARRDGVTIAIDELDSQQLGVTTTSPVQEGTNRGFSHFFELNNFFASNDPTQTGDTLENSAINLQVEERLQENASLISLGSLERTLQPADPEADPLYTYERRSASNDTIQNLAGLTDEVVSFDAVGGLAASEKTLSGYLSDILSTSASKAATSESQARDNQILLDGLNQRIDSFQGVNIDEELANTIIFQNSYNASARVITIVGEMFDSLLGAIN